MDAPNHRHRFGRTAAVLLLAGGTIAAAGCSSDDTTDEDPPADRGTVVPPDPNGVGGGVPTDNLNPDVADTVYQSEFDDLDDD